MNNKWIILFACILLLVVGYWFTVVRTEGTTFDSDLQRKIEAQLPECQIRDEAALAMRDTGTKDVYYTSDIEDYGEKSRACHKAFVKYLRDNK